MRKSTALFILAIMASISIVLVPGTSYLLWEVTLVDPPSDSQPLRIDLPPSPWKTNLGETFEDSRGLSFRIAVYSGELRCPKTSFTVEHTEADKRWVRGLAQAVNVVKWASLLALIAASIYLPWDWGQQIRQRQWRVLSEIGILIMNGMVIIVVLALLGPAISVGPPPWSLIAQDPLCEAHVALKATGVGLDTLGNLLLGTNIVAGLAMIAIVALSLRRKAGARYSRSSFTPG